MARPTLRLRPSHRRCSIYCPRTPPPRADLRATLTVTSGVDAPPDCERVRLLPGFKTRYESDEKNQERLLTECPAKANFLTSCQRAKFGPVSFGIPSVFQGPRKSHKSPSPIWSEMDAFLTLNVTPNARSERYRRLLCTKFSKSSLSLCQQPLKNSTSQSLTSGCLTTTSICGLQFSPSYSLRRARVNVFSSSLSCRRV